MPLLRQRLQEIVHELAKRPGHTEVAVLLSEILIHEFGAQNTDIQYERQLVREVRGRIDALLGRTAFEFKRDLRREAGDAEDQLTRYLSEREAQTGAHFVGIATDGLDWVPYELQRGRLERLRGYRVRTEDPEGLISFLDAAVAIQANVAPEAKRVREELGKQSLAYQVARENLAGMWVSVSAVEEVQLKRLLWAGIMEQVYGSSMDSDDLFFQHTYLTVVAKTMAVRVLGMELPEPADLLSGRAFSQGGIEGAVESDFFDWILESPESRPFVSRVAKQVARFDLERVQTDVLKGLYESLIDPEQRHELGEYYTPDWLAARMCERVIQEPTEQRVLDPACGSGTFLFHAVRRFFAAAEAAGMDSAAAIERCTTMVFGIDVHPVAVQIARITYLLAIGEARLRQHPAISIPVYLGDSLQWNTQIFMDRAQLRIDVPDDAPLEFPAALTADAGAFDDVLNFMLEMSEADAGPEGLTNWLRAHHPMDDKDEAQTLAAYEHLRHLQRSGRDHVWKYVARNQSKPVWLASPSQRVDVLIGNPPWLSYRYMSKAMQARFRKECMDRTIWSGGNVATHQDLSGYFFARSVELYLKAGGTIAFVMPYAALNRKQFAGFRKGSYGGKSMGPNPFTWVRFDEAWAFDEGVQPLFPVPSCVLIGRRIEHRPLPATVKAASGNLINRDASPGEAASRLTWTEEPWPQEPTFRKGSTYREKFRQGATMVPRVLCVVERVASQAIGQNREAPACREPKDNAREGTLEVAPTPARQRRVRLPAAAAAGRVDSALSRPWLCPGGGAMGRGRRPARREGSAGAGLQVPRPLDGGSRAPLVFEQVSSRTSTQVNWDYMPKALGPVSRCPGQGGVREGGHAPDGLRSSGHRSCGYRPQTVLGRCRATGRPVPGNHLEQRHGAFSRIASAKPWPMGRAGLRQADVRTADPGVRCFGAAPYSPGGGGREGGRGGGRRLSARGHALHARAARDPERARRGRGRRSDREAGRGTARSPRRIARGAVRHRQRAHRAACTLHSALCTRGWGCGAGLAHGGGDAGAALAAVAGAERVEGAATAALEGGDGLGLGGRRRGGGWRGGGGGLGLVVVADVLAELLDAGTERAEGVFQAGGAEQQQEHHDDKAKLRQAKPKGSTGCDHGAPPPPQIRKDISTGFAGQARSRRRPEVGSWRLEYGIWDEESFGSDAQQSNFQTSNSNSGPAVRAAGAPIDGKIARR